MARSCVKGKGVLEERADQYDGSLTFFVVASCMVAAVGGIIFGYEIGVSGGVSSMDPFLMKFFPRVYQKKNAQFQSDESNYCKYNDQILAMFSSSVYIAGLFASLCASYVTRNHGRKNSIFIGGFFSTLGPLLNAGATNLSMLFAGRVAVGVGIGFVNQVVPLYISELAPPALRGGLNSLFQVAANLGIFTATMINYRTEKLNPSAWRLSLGLAALPAIFMTVGVFFLPETPNCLIEQGHMGKGRTVLKKLRGTDNVQAEFEDMVDARGLAKLIKHPYMDMLERTNRPQLVLAICIPAFQILTGINSILYYAPVLFQSMGFGERPSLYSSLITGTMSLFSTLLSTVTVDRWGRRALLIGGGIQMIISQIAVGVILGVRYKTGEGLSKELSDLVVIMICVFVAGFGWSWGPLGWTVPSEIFPLEIRSAGQAITVSTNLLLTFVLGQFFLSMLCTFRYGMFLFFACWICIMTIFVYLFLPETNGVPIEEMNIQWTKHWFWKRIVPPIEPKNVEANEKNPDPLEWLHTYLWEMTSHHPVRISRNSNGV